MAKREPISDMQNLADAIAAMLGDMAKHAQAVAMRDEVQRLHDGLSKLKRAQDDVDDALRASMVNGLAQWFDRELDAVRDRLGRIADAALNDLQRLIDTKVNLSPDVFAAEIRTAFRALDHKARTQALASMVADNRGPELAALVKAPSILTGLGETERDEFTDAIYSRHAAPEIAQRDGIIAVFRAGMSVVAQASTIAQRLNATAALAA